MTDWDFVFDGVVGYLKSPTWNYPIVSFMDTNCLIFEPGDESLLRYTEIHNEYSILVEELLSCYLKDVGITEEQFVLACEAGSNSSSAIADQSIFKQVWAAEDFELFKALMVENNINNNLLAENALKSSEEALVQEIMRQSKIEYEKEKERNREIENLGKTLAISKEESGRILDLAEQELLMMERSVSLSMKLEKRCEKEKQETLSDRKSKSSSPKSNDKSATKSPKDSSNSDQSSSKSASQKIGKSSKDKTDSSNKGSSPKTDRALQKGSTTPTRQESKQQKHSPTPRSEKTTNKEALQGSAKREPKVEQAGKQKHVESKPKSVSKKQGKTGTVAQPKPSESKPREMMTSSEAANSWLASAKAEAAAEGGKANIYDSKTSQGLTEEEIKEKTARFRQQAYRIKHERLAKNLQQYNEQQPVQRPKSSRAAMRQVNKDAGIATKSENTAMSPVKQTKAFSPALIQFLKAQQQQLQQQQQP